LEIFYSSFLHFLITFSKYIYNWRKMKIRQYSYDKKGIDVFLNKIKETFGENISIGYDNWSNKNVEENDDDALEIQL
jgi:PhoPQ-activated pathogenicity-related protein